MTMKTIAVIGGTGAEGGGLALRLANVGHPIVIGGREAGKAEAAASEINETLGREAARGAVNAEAAEAGDVVLLTVPYAAQLETTHGIREKLLGKILVDATVPLVPPKVGRVQLPDGGSASAALQAVLGEDVRVVSAFQNVSAHHLKDLSHEVECDVLVCGDDKEARAEVIALAEALGLRAVHAGPIANSAAAEALTSVLININRQHKVPSAGIRITGL